MERSEGRMRSWHPCPKRGWKIHSSFSGTVWHNCRGLAINMRVLEVVHSNNKHVVIYFYSPWNSTATHGLESNRTVFKLPDIWACFICFHLWSKLIQWTESNNVCLVKKCYQDNIKMSKNFTISMKWNQISQLHIFFAQLLFMPKTMHLKVIKSHRRLSFSNKFGN